MRRKTFRIPDDLDNKIQIDFKEKGLSSENDYGIQALEHFLTCRKLEQVGGFKQIIAKFGGNCIRSGCGHQRIEVGDICLWGQGVGLICMDCYVTRIGDKALVAKYLKMRELKQINKALTKENDRLADKVNVYQFYEKVHNLHEIAQRVQELGMKYMKQEFVSGAEKEKLDELLAAQRITNKSIEDINKFYEKTKLDADNKA